MTVCTVYACYAFISCITIAAATTTTKTPPPAAATTATAAANARIF